MIQLKRAYDKPSRTDGTRFLIERLWPRGVKKSSLPIAGWLKDAAPSTELRKWFSHDPERWPEFRGRYFAELKSRPEAVMPLVEAARKGGESPHHRAKEVTFLACELARALLRLGGDVVGINRPMHR
ncbi:MAG: DUF488 family protein [Terracidiphilus sp.]